MATSGLTRTSFAASGIAGGLVANGVSFFLCKLGLFTHRL